MDIVVNHLPVLLKGFRLTVEYSVLGIVLAMIFGVIAALMRLAPLRIVRVLPTIYVELFRGTPLLVQLFIIIFGIPQVLPVNQWFGQMTYPILGAAIGLALNEGAYVTEIVRAGILGVDRGQKEAAQSIGMSGGQTMRYIVLPQALKRMIPPFVNQFAQTIKDTSLLSAVGVVEMLYSGQIVINNYFDPFTIYTLIALAYFVFIWLITRFAAYLERRLQLDKR
ncbi:amino acid ABC transporter permease [Alicyclobacillus sp. SO9]|uniref:amino acid ABC transporter permease n=1 Tax=Alicyclobacillus sp. SO9 TaxID=2665646 RepID=UPI001E458517|nr:amino acid ABC transporter permease [Alicyclobacillus sp. SO9]